VNDRSVRTAGSRTDWTTLGVGLGGRRHRGWPGLLLTAAVALVAGTSLLLTGAVALVAGTSLLTLALVNTATPTAPIGGGLATAATSGKGQPADQTGGGKGKGKGTLGALHVTTLAAARQAAGFDVRTLNGMAGAQLESVSVGTVTFAIAGGPSAQPEVELRYALGSTEITVTEVRDPFSLSASLRNTAEVFTAGGADYFFLPATGDVHAAETQGADGVTLVVNFFAHPAGATVGGLDRQTAYDLIQHLG
jgi:hypothetical protein